MYFAFQCDDFADGKDGDELLLTVPEGVPPNEELLLEVKLLLVVVSDEELLDVGACSDADGAYDIEEQLLWQKAFGHINLPLLS